MEVNPEKPKRLLRWPAVRERIGDPSYGTVRTEIAASRFPAPVKLMTRGIAWRESDIDAWIDSRQPVDAKELKA